MKGFNRRLFLKTAGAAAGAALLGQGCAVTPTPTGLDDLLEEANIQIDGEKVRIPVCCSYEGNYHIDNPPKRPIFGIWAQKFEEVIHLLEDLEKGKNSADDTNAFGEGLEGISDSSQVTSILPISDPRYMQGLKNCLGFAVDMLFQGDTHSARNALAVVAYMLVNAAKIDLWLKVPKGMSGATPGDWLRVDYRDEKTQTDLWDLLTFSSASSTSGSTAVRDFVAGNGKGLDPLVAMWLDKLVVLANNLDLWVVYGGEVETLKNFDLSIWEKYSGLLSACAKENLGCENMNSSEKILKDVNALSIIYENETCSTVIGALRTRCSDLRTAVLACIKENDSIGCESALTELSAILDLYQKAVLDFSKKLDEKYAIVRETVVQNASHAWDLMKDLGNCISDNSYGAFTDSLDDWWGAKKFIGIAICALSAIPTIMTAINVPWVAPFAVKVAIASFLYCFTTFMAGSPESLAIKMAECIIESLIGAVVDTVS